MPHNTISFALIPPARAYVNNNWVNSDETNFLKKHVLARGAYLVLAPASLITTALDTIIGIGAGIGAILTLGKYKPINDFTFSHLQMSNLLFAYPYKSFLKAINPEARFRNRHEISTPPPLKRIYNAADNCQRSNNFLKKHIASRLNYALAAIVSVVIRVIASIISIPAAALSILTAGKFQSINDSAYNNFQAPGIINDLFSIIIRIINPGLNENRIVL